MSILASYVTILFGLYELCLWDLSQIYRWGSHNLCVTLLFGFVTQEVHSGVCWTLCPLKMRRGRWCFFCFHSRISQKHMTRAITAAELMVLSLPKKTKNKTTTLFSLVFLNVDKMNSLENGYFVVNAYHCFWHLIRNSNFKGLRAHVLYNENRVRSDKNYKVKKKQKTF